MTNPRADPAGPTSRSYYSQRLRLHYVDWGNPEAPPLLLVHGGQDHCRNWDWVAERLRHDWHIVAPDLAGHGDSQWSQDGHYMPTSYIYDLAQLIHQQHLAPVTIIAHSFGGLLSLRYAGIYPENVRKLVVIEGIGMNPREKVNRETPIETRMGDWIDRKRQLAARVPRRYASLDEAVRRMQEENKRLSPEQARHLTQHGINQNEDGTYSWKFDNYMRARFPTDMTEAEVERLWSRITFPTLLVYGSESWAVSPDKDGNIRHFQNARVETFEHAGHWVHHDRLDDFVAMVKGFI